MTLYRRFAALIALSGILFVQLHGLWLHKMSADTANSMMLCPTHSMMAMPMDGEKPDEAPPPSSNQTSRFCPIASARDYAAILTEAPRLTALKNTLLENRIEAETVFLSSTRLFENYHARAPPVPS